MVAPILIFWALLIFGGPSAGISISQRLAIGLGFAALWAPIMYIRVRN